VASGSHRSVAFPSGFRSFKLRHSAISSQSLSCVLESILVPINPMIGQTIAHYKITSKLGEGGMGEVFLATDSTLDRQVALKFLPASLQKDHEARERLIREAKAASKLNHKNILTVYSVASAEGRDFIVMEYVEGRSLREILDLAEELPIDQILRIGLQICDGLATAHEQGVVHRDIKPANILVTPKGQVKITDFGLATWRGATQLTKEGTTVGTAAYMAPEQIQGKKTDPRSDLFSLGVVLYEMIARRRPFGGEHEAAISYAITNEIPEPLQRYKAGVHPGLEQIVARSLEKDPSTRYQSAADMLAELKRVRREIEGSQPSMLSRTMNVAPKKSYLKPGLAGSAILVLTLVILILRPFKFEVAPEQKAAANDNSLAVLYFDNVADPSDSDKMGQMITSLLITGLSESQYLQVTSRQRLYDILSQLGKGEDRLVDRTTASQVARKAGVRWMVTGEILQSSPRIVLTAEVSEVGTGKLITTQKISGEPAEDIFAVADRMGRAIRGNLALPAQASSESTKPLGEVTTRSPEAYRYYTEGMDYYLRFYSKEARASFEKALSYDSTFAMAYYQLANLPNIQGDIEQSQREMWIKKSEMYADHASEKERLMIKFSAHFNRGERGMALAAITQLLDRWPNDVEGLWNKIFICRATQRDLEAVAAAERIIQINPQFADAYNQLAYSCETVGQLDRSQWAIERYAELLPNDANPYDSRGDLLAYSGDAAGALVQYRRALEINPEFGNDIKLAFMYLFTGDDRSADSIFQRLAQSSDRVTRSKGRGHLFIVDAYRGRFKQAGKLLDDAIAADGMEGYDGQWNLSKLQLRRMLHIANGEWPQSVRVARQVVEARDRLLSEPINTDRLNLALILARAGDKHEAEAVVDSLRNDILSLKDTTGWTNYLNWVAAYEALRIHDDARAACRAFEQTYLPSRGHDDASSFGAAYLSIGDAQNAIKTLESCVNDFDEARAYVSYYSVRCHYLLGQAYELSGQNYKAAKQYKTFLDIWKDADPGIPEIDDAKARLAKLQS